MTVTIYGIPNCDTVKKARVWLDGAGIAYRFHDYKKAGIDADTLRRWAGEVGWTVLLNRQGTTFRALAPDVRDALDEAGAIALMVAQPSVIKRPVVEGAGALLVGFNPAVWTAAFAPAP